MAGITIVLDHLVQSLLDVVIIKTGLIISEDKLIEILKLDDPENELFDNFEERKYQKVRIRSEVFDEYCLTVRKSLGQVDRTFPDLAGHMEKLSSFTEEEDDIFSLSEQLTLIFYSLRKRYPKESFDQIKKRIYKLSYAKNEIVDASIDILREMRSLSNHIFPKERLYFDGGDELEKIFNKELIPQSESFFLDQKFINFLANNNIEIDRIHWRNFERLTGEYFKREGYKVELGPGTNDGGVDLRIFNKNIKDPYIIIQCKRHKASNDVSIETVKALYTDVDFENATKGLVATTSRIAPGGKKVCALRNYPINFAENKEIVGWVKKMKKID